MNLNILKALQNLPALILAAAVAVEHSTPAGTPGQTKAGLVLNVIDTIAKIGSGLPIPAVSEVSGIIDSTVTELNTLGVFTHTTAAPAVTNPTPAPVAHAVPRQFPPTQAPAAAAPKK
jgi:hypothetical protein